MRAIGLDLGTKRIGVAVSDFSGTIASPHSVIFRSKSVRLDHQKILDLVREEEAELSATARRQFVDKVAAAIMLQAWLERRRSS